MNTLIVISPETNLPNEHSIVNALFDNGLEYFHLRKPNMVAGELKQYIEKITEKYHKKIILHSHHHIVDDMQLGGKHFTGKHLTKKRTNLHSKSFHSIEDLALNKKHYKYVFLSPIFDSISKLDYKARFNNVTLKSYLMNRANKKIKIIALGGIDENNAKTAIELGFDGVAVLGTIWELNNLKKAIIQFEKMKFAINKISAVHFTP